MAKTMTVTIQLDAQIESLLNELGLTPSQAISLFFDQIKVSRSIPFDYSLPNQETLEAMDDVRRGKNVKTFDSVKDALKALGI
jgi:DNA-damage-inducible protein J